MSVRMTGAMKDEERLARWRLRVASELEDSARVQLMARDACAEQAARLAAAMVDSIANGGKVLVFGNGGSAADSQHFAGELVGRFRTAYRPPVPVVALTTDTSVLTAIGNDFSFEDVFARQVEALARPGDVVVGISTSGRSENVRRGLAAARKVGCLSAALVGDAGGSINQEAELLVVVPSADTQRVQETHICLIHALCRLVEEELLHRESEGTTIQEVR